MNTWTLDRRALLVGSAAALALAPFRESVAQATAQGGDWLAIVKAQHKLISDLLNELISNTSASSAERQTDLKKLTVLLTAHSVAEENVLYPALAIHKFQIGSAELYLEQDAQKVLNSIINLQAESGGNESDVTQKLQELSRLIHSHAIGHEEMDLYPQLHDTASPSENALLTQKYQEFFAMVHSNTTSS